MIIQGYFIGDSPYFPVRFGRKGFEGMVRLLTDTGASRTTLLDRDVRLLGIPPRIWNWRRFPLSALGVVYARSY